MSADIAVLVPSATADDPWVAGALEAARRLRSVGANVDIVVGQPGRLPEAAVVVCHGIQCEALVHEPTMGTVVLSDLPTSPTPANVTAVDWCWPEAAHTLGRLCALVSEGPVGFVAGPTVPTQRHVVASFAEGLSDRGRLAAVHVPAFDDIAAGAVFGTTLARDIRCRVVAHSADSAGVAALRSARRPGVATFGFLAPDPDDTGWIRCDIAGALATLCERALGNEPLPSVFAADGASGFSGVALHATASREWRRGLDEARRG